MDISHEEIEKSIFIDRLARCIYEYSPFSMVESSGAEYFAAEVTFLALRTQYSAEEAPRFMHR